MAEKISASQCVARAEEADRRFIALQRQARLAASVPKQKPETPKEKRDRTQAETPVAQLAKVMIASQKAKRQERIDNEKQRTQQMQELAEYRTERQEYLQLKRRHELGSMLKSELARYQEIRGRHE
jgi:hypothetical protein